MNDLESVGDFRNPQLTAWRRELGHDSASDGDFTFDDFIDIINPLQHIPVVSTLYRQISGDEISAPARVFGGTLFGGPSGFLSAVANVFFDEVAGQDIGETMIALVTGEDAAGEPQFAEGGDMAGGEKAMAAAAPVEAAAGPGMLTGQAALDALFNDLRGNAVPTTAQQHESAAGIPAGLPPAGREAAADMKSYPLPPRPSQPVNAASAPQSKDAETEAPAVTHPLLFAHNAGEADIAERMMQALDKYKAMARQQREVPRTEKDEDEARWRWADPLIGPGAR